MKVLVNLIQLIVVVAIVFPVFYIWDTDKVENLCKRLEPGMEKAEFMQLTDDLGVRLEGPTFEGLEGGKWHARVITYTPFIEHSCLIKGAGKKVAVAKLSD
jgi:hypothetical protein